MQLTLSISCQQKKCLISLNSSKTKTRDKRKIKWEERDREEWSLYGCCCSKLLIDKKFMPINVPADV